MPFNKSQNGYPIICSRNSRYRSLRIVTRRSVDTSRRSEAAYDYYLAGKDLVRKSVETDSLNQARESFEKAIAEDSRFVQAYSGLCSTNIFLYESSKNPALFESAERACNRALTLEPTEAEAYLALGNLYRYSGQLQLAEPQLQRVLRLEPDNADAHIAMGYVKSDLQKYDEALLEFNLAVESQPGYWRSFNARGAFYYSQGVYSISDRELYRGHGT